jgi:hypothetical protein
MGGRRKGINDDVQAQWRGERRGKEVAERIRRATARLAEHQPVIQS